ncbi:MAG: glycosyltransferase family 39 protein [Patescibacteria group bacterium]|nr:glycosyltransferase family 39 protein [Patescibacteria group bacterium]MBU1870746.1 glycosyltransferase family 39 protein [Patescibacteria group bacterium]
MLEKVHNYFKKNWRITVLIIIAVCFFIGTSSFNYFTQKNNFVKWLSPDETANYAFAKLYSQQNYLQFFDSASLYAADIVHPRSFRSDAGWLKPVSFLGIILIYGKIASLVSYKIIPYLTPLIAGIGIIFYYLLIAKIFNRRLAFIAALLLASFPVYIYYSVRSMFHNVLFTVLLIIGLYFITFLSVKKSVNNKIDYKGLIFACLSGIFIGLAIITRTSELLWLGPLLVILLLFNIKKIDLVKILIFLSFLFFALLPAAYWNKILYGSYWQGGYSEMNNSIVELTQTSVGFVKTILSSSTNITEKYGFIKDILSQFKKNIFFFGWHPDFGLTMLNRYFIKMFWWLFWPAVLGVLIFISKIKKWQVKDYAYLSSYTVISIILLLYYGSWNFFDNPDPTKFTIGNSYTRYWLFIYLGALPFVSLVINKFADLFKCKIFGIITKTTIVLFITFISLTFVLIGSEEGLIPTAKKQAIAINQLTEILKLTENNSVIISRYHDKLLFSERRVIVGLFNDPKMNYQYAKLAEILPVYYYNFSFRAKDLNYLNNNKLPKFNLQISKVKKITEDFTLYKLNFVTNK